MDQKSQTLSSTIWNHKNTHHPSARGICLFALNVTLSKVYYKVKKSWTTENWGWPSQSRPLPEPAVLLVLQYSVQIPDGPVSPDQTVLDSLSSFSWSDAHRPVERLPSLIYCTHTCITLIKAVYQMQLVNYLCLGLTWQHNKIIWDKDWIGAEVNNKRNANND